MAILASSIDFSIIDCHFRSDGSVQSVLIGEVGLISSLLNISS